MIMFIHMTDYSISILGDRHAVYSIHKLPAISVVVRRNYMAIFYFFFPYYHSNIENFKAITTVAEVRLTE